MDTISALIKGLIVIPLIIFLCLLPTYIAHRRRHNNFTAIVVTNIVGGLFYGIGWIIALIWACTDNVHPEEPSRREHSREKYPLIDDEMRGRKPSASVQWTPEGKELLSSHGINPDAPSAPLRLKSQKKDDLTNDNVKPKE